MVYFPSDFIRVLRGLADRSYGGLIPTAEDLYRLQLETVLCVDRDGVASSTGKYEGPSPRDGTNVTDPQAHTTVPLTKQGVEQLITEPNGTSGATPTQQNGFSPIDFLANSTGFSFGTPISSLNKDEGLGHPPKLDGNDTSLLPKELMMYNDFMTDIGETARFFDHELRNSALFVSVPTSQSDSGFVQGVELQMPNTIYG